MYIKVKATKINDLKIDSATIYYDISDPKNLHDGKPVLFLLPGGPGFDHAIYKSHSRNFENFAHVIYIDPRGCGKSDPCKLDIEYCIDMYIADVEAIRQHLGLKKIFMLGTSYGSMVAQGYAVKYHENLSGLILIAGAPSFHFLELAKANLSKRGNADQIKICKELLWDGNFENEDQVAQFFSIMSPLYSSKTTKNTATAESKQAAPYSTVKCNITHVNQAYKTNYWQFDYTNSLRNISCHTLILFGENDWINDPSYAKIIADEIPHSRFHILKDCGHSVAADQPELYRSLIQEFVSQQLTVKYTPIRSKL